MVHLHCHSHFSFLGGTFSPYALAEAAFNMEHEAVALTDTHSVAGIAQFQKHCRKDPHDPKQGWRINPIVGATIEVDGFPLVLLCLTLEGYANLCDLLTQSLRDRLNPRLSLTDLQDRTGDLICLTGDRNGALAHCIRYKQYAQAQKWVQHLKPLFPGRLFIELTHHCRPGDGAVMNTLQELARETNLHCVAANAVRYIKPDRYALYDALTCVRLKLTICDPHRDRPVNAQAYFRSEQEMLDLGFSQSSIAVTHDIARQCDVDLHPGHVTPPEAYLPAEWKTTSDYLRHLCEQGLEIRYGKLDTKAEARKILSKELDVINTLELAEFFMVVQEIILQARKCGIRCSGRGSAANSIVAYLLGITPVDPIEHKLLFERFLHTGRSGMPDIDVDFETHRRDEIIAWIDRRYGKEYTAMTANINTYRMRMAARDMCKVLGFPPLLIDRLAKVLPHSWNNNLNEYRRDIVEVLGQSPLLETLITLVEQLQDCPRHLSLHSGGMILSRSPLRYYSPTQESANGVRQIQFDKDSVEMLGLIKFDVLGLRTLSVVTKAVNLIKEDCGKLIDIDHLPPGDEKTYELIRSVKTMSVFQIESPGQWNLLSRSQPENFDDLVAQVALFRPGPLQGNMVGPYVDRRSGQRNGAKGSNPKPERIPDSVWEVVESTCGVILYQEQILDIAHKFAGLSLRESDEFRRLMSKFRDPGQMEDMRGLFVSKATEKFVSSLPQEVIDDPDLFKSEVEERRDVAGEIFTSISKFVGYGFCRSHAAAFAMIVYQTAYLKAHYPAAYMAAVLEHKPGFYPMNTVLEEAKHCDVPVLPVCIHRSCIEYQLEPFSGRRRKEFAIRVPLTQVEGINAESAGHIHRVRTEAPFRSIEDAYRRLKLHSDNWDSLARAGAFDAFGDRRKVLWQLGQLARTIGPSGCSQPVLDNVELPDYLPLLHKLSNYQRAEWDLDTLGLTAGPHPVALHRSFLKNQGAATIQEVRDLKPGTRVITTGAVIARQRPPTAKGMCFLVIEDETARIPTAMTPPVFEQFRYELRNRVLMIEGKLEGAGPGQIGDYRSILIDKMWPLHNILGGYSGHPGHMAR